MSATLSEGHGAAPTDPARVSGVGALALGALRPADTRAAAAQGRGARAAGSDAHGVGRDAAGGDAGRSRPLAVPGRGPSGRSTRGCGSWTDPGRRGRGCCGCCGRTAALPAPRPPGRRAGACRDDRHAGAERDVGHRRRAGLHRGTTGGAGSSQRSSTGTRSVWDGTCARLGAGLRRSSRSPRGSGASMAPSTPTALEGWRCGWTTAASTCPTTFSTRSGIGAFGPATALSRNRKRTAWRSGGIARSRSKRSTGASSRTSRRYAPQ